MALGNILTPFNAVAIDSSAATQGAGDLAYRCLIVGQRTTGTATADTVERITSSAQAQTKGGRGSMLHRQALAWYASNTSTELWLGVLDDDGGGVAATYTISATGPATAAGTIAIYLGGVRITVGVADADADTDIAAAIDAAINADLDLPVTSSVALAVVTVTYRHKGLTGNSYDIRHSHTDGEELPAGVGLVIAADAAGTTNPDLAGLIAALGDTWYQVIAHPYTDATSLTALETEMARRNGETLMVDGVLVTGAQGTVSALGALGDARNSQFSCIVAQDGASPLTPPVEHAAEVAALTALEAQVDPARPLTTVALSHTLAIPEADRLTRDERNLLLLDSIATTLTSAGDVVRIERIVTTYQKNAAGGDDAAYRDVLTVLTLLFLRYTWRTRLAAKYSRHKLADDGQVLGIGQKVMTPSVGVSEALNWFDDMASRGLVENKGLFQESLEVARDLGDPNRMNFLLPPDLVNQLLVTSTTIGFRH